MHDLLAWNLSRVVGIKNGFKRFKLSPSVVLEGGIVCLNVIPESVKPIDMREDSVIHVEIVEGIFFVHLVSTIVPQASFKAAAFKGCVPEMSSHKHSIDENAFNKLGTHIPVLSPLKYHILKCDIFKMSVLEVHVPEANISEVRVPHKTVDDEFILKHTAFKCVVR